MRDGRGGGQGVAEVRVFAGGFGEARVGGDGGVFGGGQHGGDPVVLERGEVVHGEWVVDTPWTGAVGVCPLSLSCRYLWYISVE